MAEFFSEITANQANPEGLTTLYSGVLTKIEHYLTACPTLNSDPQISDPRVRENIVQAIDASNAHFGQGNHLAAYNLINELENPPPDLSTEDNLAYRRTVHLAKGILYEKMGKAAYEDDQIIPSTILYLNSIHSYLAVADIVGKNDIISLRIVACLFAIGHRTDDSIIADFLKLGFARPVTILNTDDPVDAAIAKSYSRAASRGTMTDLGGTHRIIRGKSLPDGRQN